MPPAVCVPCPDDLFEAMLGDDEDRSRGRAPAIVGDLAARRPAPKIAYLQASITRSAGRAGWNAPLSRTDFVEPDPEKPSWMCQGPLAALNS